MAEQPTTTVADNKLKAPTNGVDKIPWTQTPEGRKALSDRAKAAHAAKRRSTRPVAEDKIDRLLTLIKGGSSVKEASELIGMGYSTAQRYALASKKGAVAKKSPSVKVKKTKSAHSRLSPAKLKLLTRLLPQMGSKLTAGEIAKRVGCHLTSVYFYRKKMLADTGSAPSVAGAPQQHGLSRTDYADLEEVYELLWAECQAKSVEPTNAELCFTRVWRRMR